MASKDLESVVQPELLKRLGKREPRSIAAEKRERMLARANKADSFGQAQLRTPWNTKQGALDRVAAARGRIRPVEPKLPADKPHPRLVVPGADSRPLPPAPGTEPEATAVTKPAASFARKPAAKGDVDKLERKADKGLAGPGKRARQPRLKAPRARKRAAPAAARRRVAVPRPKRKQAVPPVPKTSAGDDGIDALIREVDAEFKDLEKSLPAVTAPTKAKLPDTATPAKAATAAGTAKAAASKAAESATGAAGVTSKAAGTAKAAAGTASKVAGAVEKVAGAGGVAKSAAGTAKQAAGAVEKAAGAAASPASAAAGVAQAAAGASRAATPAAGKGPQVELPDPGTSAAGTDPIEALERELEREFKELGLPPEGAVEKPDAALNDLAATTKARLKADGAATGPTREADALQPTPPKAAAPAATGAVAKPAPAAPAAGPAAPAAAAAAKAAPAPKVEIPELPKEPAGADPIEQWEREVEREIAALFKDLADDDAPVDTAAAVGVVAQPKPAQLPPAPKAAAPDPEADPAKKVAPKATRQPPATTGATAPTAAPQPAPAAAPKKSPAPVAAPAGAVDSDLKELEKLERELEGMLREIESLETRGDGGPPPSSIANKPDPHGQASPNARTRAAKDDADQILRASGGDAPHAGRLVAKSSAKQDNPAGAAAQAARTVAGVRKSDDGKADALAQAAQAAAAGSTGAAKLVAAKTGPAKTKAVNAGEKLGVTAERLAAATDAANRAKTSRGTDANAADAVQAADTARAAGAAREALKQAKAAGGADGSDPIAKLEQEVDREFKAISDAEAVVSPAPTPIRKTATPAAAKDTGTGKDPAPSAAGAPDKAAVVAPTRAPLEARADKNLKPVGVVAAPQPGAVAAPAQPGPLPQPKAPVPAPKPVQKKVEELEKQADVGATARKPVATPLPKLEPTKAAGPDPVEALEKQADKEFAEVERDGQQGAAAPAAGAVASPARPAQPPAATQPAPKEPAAPKPAPKRPPRAAVKPDTPAGRDAVDILEKQADKEFAEVEREAKKPSASGVVAAPVKPVKPVAPVKPVRAPAAPAIKAPKLEKQTGRDPIEALEKQADKEFRSLDGGISPRLGIAKPAAPHLQAPVKKPPVKAPKPAPKPVAIKPAPVDSSDPIERLEKQADQEFANLDRGTRGPGIQAPRPPRRPRTPAPRRPAPTPKAVKPAAKADPIEALERLADREMAEVAADAKRPDPATPRLAAIKKRRPRPRLPRPAPPRRPRLDAVERLEQQADREFKRLDKNLPATRGLRLRAPRVRLRPRRKARRIVRRIKARRARVDAIDRLEKQADQDMREVARLEAQRPRKIRLPRRRRRRLIARRLRRKLRIRAARGRGARAAQDPIERLEKRADGEMREVARLASRRPRRLRLKIRRPRVRIRLRVPRLRGIKRPRRAARPPRIDAIERLERQADKEMRSVARLATARPRRLQLRVRVRPRRRRRLPRLRIRLGRKARQARRDPIDQLEKAADREMRSVQQLAARRPRRLRLKIRRPRARGRLRLPRLPRRLGLRRPRRQRVDAVERLEQRADKEMREVAQLERVRRRPVRIRKIRVRPRKQRRVPRLRIRARAARDVRRDPIERLEKAADREMRSVQRLAARRPQRLRLKIRRPRARARIRLPRLRRRLGLRRPRRQRVDAVERLEQRADKEMREVAQLQRVRPRPIRVRRVRIRPRRVRRVLRLRLRGRGARRARRDPIERLEKAADREMREVRKLAAVRPQRLRLRIRRPHPRRGLRLPRLARRFGVRRPRRLRLDAVERLEQRADKEMREVAQLQRVRPRPIRVRRVRIRPRRRRRALRLPIRVRARARRARLDPIERLEKRADREMRDVRRLDAARPRRLRLRIRRPRVRARLRLPRRLGLRPQRQRRDGVERLERLADKEFRAVRQLDRAPRRRLALRIPRRRRKIRIPRLRIRLGRALRRARRDPIERLEKRADQEMRNVRRLEVEGRGRRLKLRVPRRRRRRVLNIRLPLRLRAQGRAARRADPIERLERRADREMRAVRKLDAAPRRRLALRIPRRRRKIRIPRLRIRLGRALRRARRDPIERLEKRADQEMREVGRLEVQGRGRRLRLRVPRRLRRVLNVRLPRRLRARGRAARRADPIDRLEKRADKEMREVAKLATQPARRLRLRVPRRRRRIRIPRLRLRLGRHLGRLRRDTIGHVEKRADRVRLLEVRGRGRRLQLRVPRRRIRRVLRLRRVRPLRKGDPIERLEQRADKEMREVAKLDRARPGRRALRIRPRRKRRIPRLRIKLPRFARGARRDPIDRLEKDADREMRSIARPGRRPDLQRMQRILRALRQKLALKVMRFGDSSFAPGDWDSKVRGTGRSSSRTEGGYRRLNLTVGRFQSVVNYHIFKKVVYQPKLHGPVKKAVLSYKIRRVFTSNAGATQVAKGLVVEQNGRIFSRLLGVSVRPTWEAVRADLVRLFPQVNWKSGGPIRFGFYNSVSASVTPFTIAGGYDNFRLHLERTPPALPDPRALLRLRKGAGRGRGKKIRKLERGGLLGLLERRADRIRKRRLARRIRRVLRKIPRRRAGRDAVERLEALADKEMRSVERLEKQPRPRLRLRAKPRRKPPVRAPRAAQRPTRKDPIEVLEARADKEFRSLGQPVDPRRQLAIAQMLRQLRRKLAKRKLSAGDSAFAADSWDTKVRGTGRSFSRTEGGYRRLSLTVGRFQSALNTHIFKRFRYIPRLHGPVKKAIVSYKIRRVYTSNAGATQVCKGLVVEQDGKVFHGYGGVSTSTTWEPVRVDLVKRFPQVNWKDGGPIRFGFYNSVSASVTPFTIAGGYDDFRIDLERTPPAVPQPKALIRLLAGARGGKKRPVVRGEKKAGRRRRRRRRRLRKRAARALKLALRRLRKALGNARRKRRDPILALEKLADKELKEVVRLGSVRSQPLRIRIPRRRRQARIRIRGRRAPADFVDRLEKLADKEMRSLGASPKATGLRAIKLPRRRRRRLRIKIRARRTRLDPIERLERRADKEMRSLGAPIRGRRLGRIPLPRRRKARLRLRRPARRRSDAIERLEKLADKEMRSLGGGPRRLNLFRRLRLKLRPRRRRRLFPRIKRSKPRLDAVERLEQSADKLLRATLRSGPSSLRLRLRIPLRRRRRLPRLRIGRGRRGQDFVDRLEKLADKELRSLGPAPKVGVRMPRLPGWVRGVRFRVQVPRRRRLRLFRRPRRKPRLDPIERLEKIADRELKDLGRFNLPSRFTIRLRVPRRPRRRRPFHWRMRFRRGRGRDVVERLEKLADAAFREAVKPVPRGGSLRLRLRPRRRRRSRRAFRFQRQAGIAAIERLEAVAAKELRETLKPELGQVDVFRAFAPRAVRRTISLFNFPAAQMGLRALRPHGRFATHLRALRGQPGLDRGGKLEKLAEAEARRLDLRRPVRVWRPARQPGVHVGAVQADVRLSGGEGSGVEERWGRRVVLAAVRLAVLRSAKRGRNIRLGALNVDAEVDYRPGLRAYRRAVRKTARKIERALEEYDR